MVKKPLAAILSELERRGGVKRRAVQDYFHWRSTCSDKELEAAIRRLKSGKPLERYSPYEDRDVTPEEIDRWRKEYFAQHPRVWKPIKTGGKEETS